MARPVRPQRLSGGSPSVSRFHGRRTYARLATASRRDNIVVTRDAGFSAGGTERAASVDDALDIARRKATERGVDEIMVIGGAEIFALTLPLADRIYLTRIHARPDGDVTFPEPDPGIWREVSRSPLPPDARDDAKATLLILRTGRPVRRPVEACRAVRVTQLRPIFSSNGAATCCGCA